VALRMAYAGAVARLDEQGVEPAAHRTILYPSATVWGGDGGRWRAPEVLQSLRDSMPMPLGDLPAPPAVRSPAAAPAPARATAAPPPATDPQLIELLSRLFDAIQGDRGVPADVAALLQRLQPTVLRVALLDPSLLTSYDHAVWRFMDQVAHQIALCAPSDRLRLSGLCRNLIDHLAGGEASDSSRFTWALDRLAANHRHGLSQAVAAAAPVIARLLRAAQADAQPSTATMPLDVGTLDTVPAALLPDEPLPPAADPRAALAGRPGDHWRVYLQGDWRALQLLWHDDGHELWLLRENAADRQWAVRVHAIERLRQERLAHPLRVRSLVQRAAAKVMKSL
jgi:hypothetical protein